MIDQRLDLLTDWLSYFFDDENFVITSASDDASFRRYFRVERNNNTFIAMDAPPEKEDSATFVKIATLLSANNLHAPKIITSDLAQGFLLLEDLGNTTFLQTLNKDNCINLYKKAINALVKIQKIDYENNDLPYYDDAVLKGEMQLLIDWYLPKDTSDNHKQQLLSVFDTLSNNALNSLQVFVHRDYHARNLMLTENGLAIIDFQDAIIGSNTYDLCSLLKDAYLELSANDIQTLLNYYYTQASIDIEFSQFEEQFELMGLQRHLKILGIFKRLSMRDGKHQYLNDLPLVKKYALQIADKYPEFSVLKDIL
ncbi:aminoglycoside phosphotransferase family protein [bacterium endosymbiont of Bathymodiolus sp. 5 South]|jgi:aminoglycoside/choline kinase family phosphotransferase|uniref:aminoglycoside phosphotransferase family protein n=1 Tax=bacterium endosymbiont of Bathymodiolus sp. 5 South TaxID=1181670 RepID=UPI0010B3FB82|nr:phosphotransferase [bacterium endosymbiont of Bathymodiolus sp. 5 South]CAC9641655.1 Phosphotransferase involved in threonylcarbamoyladenosine t(6)A37 formation in tRNA [uncultured Gammaproteobacteria bacterium]CAC9644670.1 Phosphotransferase involved in threonylcarbamoyladenosine t(6)A37 formation in tRNA [uncultured Gammaproteobacteria bacterium]SHN92451.1 COG3178: Predicted phosphotransferase related toSer/Thr protein kinases [bacterium endosymbiont of Bathymodiolus sp. 5 South]SSC09077.1